MVEPLGPDVIGPPQPEGPSTLNMWEEMPFSSRRMGSGRRKVIWALCFLLLLLEAGSAKNLWKRALHPRLAEKPRAEEAAGPRQPRADRCPPPPRSLPPGACQAARCQADSECPRHRRCCYNGCAYACLEAVPPPPVLDWLVQPKPRWLGGNGWLLDGPEEVLQAEACSTTEDGAEPLLCPSGYECHILSPGDVAEGIPNRGQCVKQRRQAELPIVGIFVVSPTFRLLFGVMSTFSHQTAWAPVATWLLTAAYVFIPKEKEGPGMLHRRQPGQTQPFASENSCGPHC
ncbi:WAP four-disulfide core domain protein 1 isoform X1 [Canis lupus dingo]|uniref:WAP four-disulfide core domain protein 1 isoform X1 n=1 Tax=Canis lupus dingo TaxID=286419 RepID=UPI0020C305D3|nr:WAP four-disulfide core domain protein 1 isoform X1 [Canis lupus dingo]